MEWINTFKDLPEDEKNALVQKAYDLGYLYEAKYGNCSQCTLAAIDDVFGCVDEEVFKSAYTLAAGLGLTSKCTCGALNAGAMIISSMHGRARSHFESGARYPACYELSRRFLNRFLDRYGSGACHEIQKSVFGGKSYDLSIPEQFAAFEAAGGHRDKCPSVVGASAKLLAEMIVNGEL